MRVFTSRGFYMTVPECDSRYMFSCDGGKCLPNHVQCDEIKHCRDGTDEVMHCKYYFPN